MDLVIKNETGFNFFPNYQQIATNFIHDNINYMKLNAVATAPDNYQKAAAAAAAAAAAVSVTSTAPTMTSSATAAALAALKCNICDKQFTDANRLAVHVKRHNDKKPTSFECTICFKSFSQQGNLKVINKDLL